MRGSCSGRTLTSQTNPRGRRVKRISTLIALCAALVSGMAHVAHAQDDTLKRWRTCGYSNGRFWEDANTKKSAHQATYLMGLLDMNTHERLSTNLNLGLKPPNLWPGVWPKGATIGEVIQALDQFYQDPANLQIPVVDAVSLIKDRFEGKDPQAIEKDIRVQREWAVSCQQNHEE
jgi:hypothetical protein